MDDLKFTASPPLGRLGRWLRILGFDCVYQAHREDTVPRGHMADRILLTRHIDPAERHVIFIGQDGLFDQLRVMDDLICLRERTDPLSRCIQCNIPLVPMQKNEAKQEVPEHVFLTHDEFMGCPSCGKIYWPGTHVDRMNERMADIFRKQMPKN